MNPSSNPLVDAIKTLDLEKVRSLMAEGANPFSGEPGATNAAQAWLESQALGNPYSIEMAKVLFQAKPRTAQEHAALDALALGQVKRLAVALGEAEVGNRLGIDIEVARTGVQTLEETQGCWALVRQAFTNTYDTDPVVPVDVYAEAMAQGMTQANAWLTPIGNGAMLRPHSGELRPNPALVEHVWRSIADAVDADHMTVLPRGAVATVTSDFSTEAAFFYGETGMVGTTDHFASTYRSSFEQAAKDKSDEMNGIKIKAWWPANQEGRLVEALRAQDWTRAQRLIQAGPGADINHVATTFMGGAAWLGNAQTLEQTQALLDLGADPWLASQPDGATPNAKKELPIHQAKSQEQFNLLMMKMKERQPHMDTSSFQAENWRVSEFYKQSPYFVDKRSLGQRAVDGLVERVGNGLGKMLGVLDEKIGPKPTPQPEVTHSWHSDAGAEPDLTSLRAGRQASSPPPQPSVGAGHKGPG